MIQDFPVQYIGQQDRLVVLDVVPQGWVSMAARVYRALNPRREGIPVGLSGEDMVTTAVDPAKRSALLASLSKAATVDKSDPAGTNKLTDALVSYARWLQAGGSGSLYKERSFGAATAAQPTPGASSVSPALEESYKRLTGLSGTDIELLNNGSNAAAFMAWDGRDEGIAFTRFALEAGFGRLTATQFLSGPIEVPTGLDKATWAVQLRARRALAAVSAVHRSWKIVPLREIAALLSEPAFAPMIDTATGSERADLEAAIAWVRAQRLHPVLARAMRVCEPAVRPTVFSRANRTLGLSRGGLFAALTAAVFDNGRSGVGAGAELREFLLGDKVLGALLNGVRELKWDRAAVGEEETAAAESAMGFVVPGAPPQIPLSGADTLPIVASLGAMTEAISDEWVLLMRPTIPLREPDQTSLTVGAAALVRYNPAGWGDQKTREEGDFARPRLVPFAIQEHDPVLNAQFAARKVTPSSILPLDAAHYFGDADAVIYPNTPEGVAHALGVAAGRVPALKGSLNKGVTLDGKTPTHTYRASATGGLPRALVKGLEGLAPTTMIGVAAQLEPVKMPVLATWARTDDLPVLPASRDAAATRLAELAGEW